MGKAKKLVTMTMPRKMAPLVRSLIKDLTEDSKPARPIKRKTRFTPSQVASMQKDVIKVGSFLRKVSDEVFRIEDILDSRLTKEDRIWYEAHLKELEVLLNKAAF